MPTLRLSLLGSLEIRDGDQRLPKPPTLKSQSLLAYLALHRDRPQPRARLASLFWGDRPEHKARRSLTTALWHLRRCLPSNDLLLCDAQTVQFDPQADLWLDVTAFESLASSSDPSRLRAAVALYRGELMDGFYDDWVLNERYRMETLFAEALARLMTGLEAQGAYDEALSCALRLLACDPLREDAHRLAMRAYCRLGRRNAALEQYRRCLGIVARELDAEPMEETTALYQAIMDGHIEVVPAHALAGESVRVAPPRPAGQDPLDPVVRGPLVGREEELAFLRSCYEEAQAGHSVLVLVHGDAGTGKTRLAEELANGLRWQGTRILWGRCYEFERILPYQPLGEALRAVLATTVPEDLGNVPPWVVGELARLVPGLPEALPGAVRSAEVPLDQEQAQLFEAVARFLAKLSAGGGLLLVLDDLHWATESTLQMVHYLARRLAGRQVLIIGTLRPEAVVPGHALDTFRRELAREGLVRSLDLSGLSPQAVEALVVQMAGSSSTTVAPLARHLYDETEGNPFFLVESVKALFEAGLLRLEDGVWSGDFAAISRSALPLPVEVSEAIQARVSRLDEDVRGALHVAAVLGREFDLSLLDAVWKQGEEAALEVLDTLLRRRLIDEGSGVLGRDYAFHHHKIQEVVYAGIPLRHRQYLHAQAGKAMETLYAPDAEGLAGELAYHFLEGRYVDSELAARAVRYLLLAGDQARLAYAHGEAIGYYGQALALQQERGECEGAAQTLMKLGLSSYNALDFQQARAAFDEAFALRVQAAKTPPPVPPPPAPHALRLPWYEPVTLDPALAADTYSGGVIRHLFSGLVKLSAEMGILPDVAQRWEVHEDGCRFVFTLRDDVHWSDGIRLTAYDFEYAWKRVLDPATASPNSGLLLDIQGARAWQAGERHGPLGVRALDATTLVVELEEPAGHFLHLLSHQARYPVPRHVVEEYGSSWAAAERIVTNGPFRLGGWQHGESMRLVRDLAHHAPRSGNVEQVVLSFLPAVRSAELALYEADRLDVVTLRDPPLVALARRRHPGEYVSYPMLSTLYVGFDASRPPFHDPRVRRAFALAVDRERMADVHLGGQVFPATGGFVPAGMPGHTPGIGLPYHPERARQLLDEAGYPDGRGFPAIEALSPGLLVDARTEAKQLQAYWRDNLCIEVEWQALEVGAWFERLDSEPPHLHLVAWMADYPDPGSFMRDSPFRRRTRWQNDAYERLIDAAKRAMALEDRIRIYQQADAILMAQAPIMPVYYDRGHLLVKPWVSRFPTSSIDWYGRWEDAIIDPH